MPLNTAAAENKIPNTPFNAQYHGVFAVATSSTSRIPVGKKTPNRMPTGKIRVTLAAILRESEDATISFATGGNATANVAMSKAVTKG